MRSTSQKNRYRNVILRLGTPLRSSGLTVFGIALGLFLIRPTIAAQTGPPQVIDLTLERMVGMSLSSSYQIRRLNRKVGVGRVIRFRQIVAPYSEFVKAAVRVPPPSRPDRMMPESPLAQGAAQFHSEVSARPLALPEIRVWVRRLKRSAAIFPGSHFLKPEPGEIRRAKLYCR